MEIRYSRRFKKQFHKLPEKIQQQFSQRVRLFVADSHHPTLNIHALAGKYSGCLSMNVSGNVRAIFEYEDNKKTILFLIIGTHSQIY